MQGIFSQELVTRVKEEGGSQSQAEDPGGEPEIGNSRNPLPDPGLGERVGGEAVTSYLEVGTGGRELEQVQKSHVGVETQR